MTERPPKFCPDCGAALTADNAVVGVIDDRSGDGGYDCYCEVCGWSGDISPDDEHGRFADEVAAQSGRSRSAPTWPSNEPRTQRR